MRSAYHRCLELAAEHGCESLAFPAISTGIYGYPMDQAASIALQTTIEFLRTHEAPQLVGFVLSGRAAYDRFVQILAELSG